MANEQGWDPKDPHLETGRAIVREWSDSDGKGLALSIMIAKALREAHASGARETPKEGPVNGYSLDVAKKKPTDDGGLLTRVRRALGIDGAGWADSVVWRDLSVTIEIVAVSREVFRAWELRELGKGRP